MLGKKLLKRGFALPFLSVLASLAFLSLACLLLSHLSILPSYLTFYLLLASS
jgi:hypothetical protein